MNLEVSCINRCLKIVFSWQPLPPILRWFFAALHGVEMPTVIKKSPLLLSSVGNAMVLPADTRGTVICCACNMDVLHIVMQKHAYFIGRLYNLLCMQKFYGNAFNWLSKSVRPSSFGNVFTKSPFFVYKAINGRLDNR